jgi:hypothetical protein
MAMVYAAFPDFTHDIVVGVIMKILMRLSFAENMG